MRVGLDTSPIFRGLYQGEAPPAGSLLRKAGFDTIILCAAEWQPPVSADEVCCDILGYIPETDPYPGVSLFHAPNDDDFKRTPSREVLAGALRAANHTAASVLQGAKVLVSCWAGINRSGLVTGLTLHKLTGLSGSDCIKVIRKGRPQALSNPQFVKILNKIPSAKAPKT